MEKQIEKALKDEGFTILSIVGQGGFASVYRVSWDRYPLIDFAAKVFQINAQQERDIYGSYIKEIASLKFLDHPNIIKFFKYFEIDDACVLIFEYCHRGCLYKNVLDNGPFTEQQFLPIAKQCLEALNACHMMNITHRDIKPGNILVDCNNRIKLSDFGLASYITKGQKVHGFTGSLAFLPPEVLKAKLFDPVKADIWALSVTFCFLLTKEIPWQYKTQDELINAICNYDPDFPKGISNELKNMLDKMLCKKPECRPSAFELLNSPFFKKTAVNVPKPNHTMAAKKSSSFMILKTIPHKRLTMKGTLSQSTASFMNDEKSQFKS